MSRRRLLSRLRAALVVTCGVAMLLGAGGVRADRGVALDVGSIRIDEVLEPGGSYGLPTIRVRNPGTERTRYVMTVSGIAGQQALVPDEEWFTFTPAQFGLAPGASAPVTVSMQLPSGADAGQYAGLLGAQIVTPEDGAQVGARAAARLTFEVAEASWLTRLWIDVKQLLASPWTWIVGAVLALVLVVLLLRKRVAVSVRWRG